MVNEARTSLLNGVYVQHVSDTDMRIDVFVKCPIQKTFFGFLIIITRFHNTILKGKIQ